MNLPFRNFLRREPARAQENRQEEKASRTGALIALLSNHRPRWTPRDYHALAREGYARNPIAFRSVRMIAEAAANVPLTTSIRCLRCSAGPIRARPARI